MSFALTWRDQEYVSPVDGRTYQAEGGWDAYGPTTPEGAPATNEVTIKQVRLLMAVDEVGARTSADELAAFCREVERCAQRAVGDRAVAAELVIRMRCTPEGHDVDLSDRAELPQLVMHAFFEAVKQLPRLPVQDGEVSFEIELRRSG
jgi:hypothetical protein